jgi:hypothetical protein
MQYAPHPALTTLPAGPCSCRCTASTAAARTHVQASHTVTAAAVTDAGGHAFTNKRPPTLTKQAGSLDSALHASAAWNTGPQATAAGATMATATATASRREDCRAMVPHCLPRSGKELPHEYDPTSRKAMNVGRLSEVMELRRQREQRIAQLESTAYHVMVSRSGTVGSRRPWCTSRSAYSLQPAPFQTTHPLLAWASTPGGWGGGAFVHAALH